MTETLNVLEQQARNRRQTSLWLLLFILFFAWLGFGGDWISRALVKKEPVSFDIHFSELCVP